MKERPILFSAPMVRAILDSRKTQTRRVFKQAIGPSLSVDCNDGVAELSWLHGDGPGHEVHETIKRVVCPYGQPGDRLWVRESFWGCDAPGYGDTPCVVYDDEWQGKEYHPAEVRPWAPKFGRIPSIHMPRNCSRITLEITGVRAERLNDCCWPDAIAEGLIPVRGPSGSYMYEYSSTEGGQFANPCVAYHMLWDSINGDGAWAANPWVWVVEFRRIKA